MRVVARLPFVALLEAARVQKGAEVVEYGGAAATPSRIVAQGAYRQSENGANVLRGAHRRLAAEVV
jgi:hypothetical protein